MSKITLIEEDIDNTIKNYEEQIYDCIKQDVSIESIKNKLLNEFDQYYELNDDSNLTQSKMIYLRTYVNQTLDHMCIEFKKRLKRIETIGSVVESLKELKLPEQRSKEWFEMRKNILTASSLADSLGKGHFNTRESLLIDKTSNEPKPFFTNDIIQWGVKYEPIATSFYERINQLKIVEFGLVPHPTFKIFGASPDGICDTDSPQYYVGRMLEIKCPPIRNFTKEVPLHYWMQIQGQLETCDLEECDFLQVKIIEYNNEQEYQEDTTNQYPKGLVLTFFGKDEKGNKTYDYTYPDFNLSYDELKSWASQSIQSYSKPYTSYEYNWWKIQRYECTLVGRDRQWWLNNMPKILSFWEDVEHYRKVGNQELLQKKENRKKKKVSVKKDKPETKKFSNIIKISGPIPPQPYLLDTDSDNES